MGGFSKQTKTVLILGLALVAMVATVPLAIWVTHTSSAQLGNEQARCSSTMQPVHTVIIRDNQAKPSHTVALQCDTLKILNEDISIKLMAFGPHEHHISYDGVSEKVLGPGQSFSVKLVQVGTFTFHDHSADTARGSFTVSK